MLKVLSVTELSCYVTGIFEAEELLHNLQVYGEASNISFVRGNIYFNLNNQNKKIDISFVGNMYGFRKEMLEKLSIDFPNLKMRFYGIYQSRKHIIAFLKFLLSGKARFFKNKNISPKRVNKLYNKSKIVLNFEHPQAEGGWSSRLVEILGSGAFQIVSHKDVLDYYFKDGLISFRSYEELVSMIKLYLENQTLRNLIMVEGHKKVFPQYTNYFQLQKIFNEIEASYGSD